MGLPLLLPRNPKRAAAGACPLTRRCRGRRPLQQYIRQGLQGMNPDPHSASSHSTDTSCLRSGGGARPGPSENASHRFTVEVGPEWSLNTTCKDISKGPHTYNLMPTVKAFLPMDILERSLWGFIIVLTKEDTIHLFVTPPCISCLALVEQHTRKMRLICYSSKAPDSVTQAVNASSDK